MVALYNGDNSCLCFLQTYLKLHKFATTNTTLEYQLLQIWCFRSRRTIDEICVNCLSNT